MAKQLVVDPVVARTSGELVPKPIPINAYATAFEDERAVRGEATLRRVLRDMVLIREFEEMLDSLKRTGTYGDVTYRHGGPAHLSIGQEAAAVGQALELEPGDHIFGSHRSHGEILAKGLAAIETLPAERLEETTETYLDGEPLRVIDHLRAGDIRERSLQFLLFGLIAEIVGRRTGFNRGLGGSMHAFFAPWGIMPNNAIVGGSAPIATGAALLKRVAQRGEITVANIGDGSTGSGPVWESLNFAAMGQLRTLWNEPFRGGLPVLFFFVNNFYAMGGQTIGETMGYDHLARIGAGVNPDNLHAETVDGNDPLAVADAVKRKRGLLLAGGGPALLDVQCYRQSGHSPSDADAYRSREEIDAWRAVDPIAEYVRRLREVGIIEEQDVDELRHWSRERCLEVCRLAVDDEVSPRLDLGRTPLAMADLMFSDRERGAPEAQASDLLASPASGARVKRIAKLSRSGLAEDGSRLTGTRAVTMRDALFEAVLAHLAADELHVAYGEEHRDWDGAFGVYRGLSELLPYHRFFNAPISEAAIVGTAVGYALSGGRAVVELMYADFIGRAGDEIFNQLAKWQAMSGGTLEVPVVVRASVGAKYGAQHSQDWTALAAHVPGLTVVFPSTPYDAKGLLASALAGSDPVLFFESQRLYDQVEVFHPGGVPAEYYRIPIGEPDVKRPGTDLTILSVGATLYRALAAADELRERFSLEAEVIDARSLVPFNFEPVVESVRKTNRLLVTGDACERGSHLESFASTLGRLAFEHLDGPVTVVGSRNWITPPSEMEETFFPQPSGMIDAVHEHLLPLEGHRASTDQDLATLLEASRRGV